jgi:hypothetical protein
LWYEMVYMSNWAECQYHYETVIWERCRTDLEKFDMEESGPTGRASSNANRENGRVLEAYVGSGKGYTRDCAFLGQAKSHQLLACHAFTVNHVLVVSDTRHQR